MVEWENKFHIVISSSLQKMNELEFTENECMNCAMSLLTTVMLQCGANIEEMARLLTHMAVEYPKAIKYAKERGYYNVE